MDRDYHMQILSYKTEEGMAMPFLGVDQRSRAIPNESPVGIKRLARVHVLPERGSASLEPLSKVGSESMPKTKYLRLCRVSLLTGNL